MQASSQNAYRAASAALCSFFFTQAAAGSAQRLPASAFAYQRTPTAVRVSARIPNAAGIVVSDVTFASPSGGKIHGRLFAPARPASRGAVLFVHWLGDPQTTNLTEFARDATELARRGCTALAIDAMWAQTDWFDKVRRPETDYAASIRQVVELRRSLDVLLAQPGVDPSRVAYVGHDFGAMYGAVLSGIDPRPRYYVLIAGTTTFSEWYLLGAKPKDTPAYVAQMKPLDPLPYLRSSRARGFLFQFADVDKYIPTAKAKSFFDAAPIPKGIFFYHTDHSVRDAMAYTDRVSWLVSQAGCRPFAN
jgi:hypothetical protein